jgi:hypothetical protein
VTKIATGPLVPDGTTHFENGRTKPNDIPPVIIWHDRFEVSPEMAGEANVSAVPIFSPPAFATARLGFAGPEHQRSE